MTTETFKCGACHKEMEEDQMLMLAESNTRICSIHVIPDWNDVLEELANEDVNEDWFKKFDKELTSLIDNWTLLLLHTPLELETIRMGTWCMKPHDIDEKMKAIWNDLVDAAMDVVDNPNYLAQQQGIKVKQGEPTWK